MTLVESYYAVLLHGDRVGTLCQRGDHTRFQLNERYLDDPRRPVLGLVFEDSPRKKHAAALRLPRWFSNLLPEGPLRQWIADARGVKLGREMELLAQVGHDLPGAVQVVKVDGPDAGWDWSPGDAPEVSAPNARNSSPWRFSLAGVALKFSMLAQGDRLTVPAVDERGDWLVKFPDYRFPNVPRHELAMMRLASELGIEVPEVRLVHRDELDGLPDRMWPNAEDLAYAVRRFDRAGDPVRTPIHIEDFAQVRDKCPDGKYDGNFETVAAVAYRGRDVTALREMTRRLAFNVLIGNGDAHLKNWSLIYRDVTVPTLSPAYDLVPTFLYSDDREDLGIKFDGTERFEAITRVSFERLEAKIDRRFGRSNAELAQVAVSIAEPIGDAWSRIEATLSDHPDSRDRLHEWISRRASQITGAEA